MAAPSSDRWIAFLREISRGGSLVTSNGLVQARALDLLRA